MQREIDRKSSVCFTMLKGSRKKKLKKGRDTNTERQKKRKRSKRKRKIVERERVSEREIKRQAEIFASIFHPIRQKIFKNILYFKSLFAKALLLS